MKIKRSLEPTLSRLEKFWLYETATFYYLVGSDSTETTFRLIKINRAIDKPKLLSDILHEDDLVYSKDDIADILGMINEGNRTSGGLTKICAAFGLVGFVKFLDCFYITLITQRKEVGCIGGNFIYSVKATEIFAIKKKDSPDNYTFLKIWKKLNKKLNQTSAEIAESRYMGLFQFVDMTKDFFFSYSYDLTHSLQHNYIVSSQLTETSKIPPLQEIFQWNYYQTNELRAIVSDGGSSPWILPIIHGSYQQTLDLMVLARRSRHYAGTRYLKRGISVHGKVANDCEVEQILQYDEGGVSNYSSYVQMRGSIPTYWCQETSLTIPKPPILLNRMDPDYLATEAHFSDMIGRYNTPIIVLDLVKQYEKRPRESLVGREFRSAVEVLNESIDAEHKIRYIALDYSKITSISKGKHKGKDGKNAKKNAMAAVGNEWAMMETSLAANAKESPGDGKKTVGGSAGASSGGGGGGAVGSNASVAGGSTHNVSALLGAGGGIPSSSILAASKDPEDGKEGGAAAGGGGGGLGPESVQTPDSKIDVLRELEDIALVTLTETQYFCNSLSYLDHVRLVSGSNLERAKSSGYIQQSGVLRTNCIDCLDRTNGGQFAVAMKFLAVALQSLGVCTLQQAIEPNSQLLLALMDMFGDMGDKIAMQYGGSEAHKKVLAGKGNEKPGAPKQNELLTSIKRYYSNAFTDNVKQDAMNVFLGCYVPSEESIPLWDLESDFNLHNKTLKPPEPEVCKVLFESILNDNCILRSPKARKMIESSIKSVLSKEKDRTPLLDTQSSDLNDESLNYSDLNDMRLSNDELVSYMNSLPVPKIALQTVMKRYFIQQNVIPSSKSPAKKTRSSVTPSPTPGGESGVIRSMARLEKRKLARRIASAKIKSATEKWWQQALDNYNLSLYGTVHPDGGKADKQPGNERTPPMLSASNSHDLLSTESYYYRYYRPEELSEFDAMLSLDFVAPVDAVQVNNQINAQAAAQKKILSPDGAEEGVVNPDGTVTPAAPSSTSFFFLPSMLSSTSSGGHTGGGGAAGGGGAGGTLSAGGVSESALSRIDSLMDPAAATAAKEGAGDESGFISRYVRDLGQKAKTLMGGFLRKEDSTTVTTTPSKFPTRSRMHSMDWNWKQQQINYHQHRVPKSSSLLYSKYVAIAHDNLILMDDSGSSRRQREEEYYILLREYNIDMDNVVNMETLAMDSYLSTQVHKGVYQGLCQWDSAFMSHGFIISSLVNVESELQSCYVQMETDNSFSRQFSKTKETHPVAGKKTGRNMPSSSTKSGAMNMELTADTQERINKTMKRMKVAAGLEAEVKRNVSNYIFQQYSYSKDISEERLSKRMSTLTNEKSIIEYTMLFDQDTLVSSFDEMNYISNDCPSYQTFTEYDSLQTVLDPMERSIATKRAELTRELEQEKTEKELKTNGTLTAESSNPAKLKKVVSLSKQLGLSTEHDLSMLEEDLNTDYSLDNVFTHYPYTEASAAVVYGREEDYPGFTLQAHDLYCRNSNHHLTMNEICVKKFNEALVYR